MTERGNKVPPYVYGEADGSGPHVIDFEAFEKEAERLKASGKDDEVTRREIERLENFPRNYADNLRIDWKTENLIYGEDAIRYLIALRDGKDNGLFPLSKQGYERLIALKRKDLKEPEERVGSYTPEQLDQMATNFQMFEVGGRARSLFGILGDLESGKLKKDEIGPETLKAIENRMAQMNTLAEYDKLQEERARLKRLEEAASKV